MARATILGLSVASEARGRRSILPGSFGELGERSRLNGFPDLRVFNLDAAVLLSSSDGKLGVCAPENRF